MEIECWTKLIRGDQYIPSSKTGTTQEIILQYNKGWILKTVSSSAEEKYIVLTILK
jgi:hypothetical protein